MLVSQPRGPRFESRNFIKIYIFNDFPQISTVKDFNFQLFGVLRGSTLRFDGSPLLFLTFYSNQSGRGVYPISDKLKSCSFLEMYIPKGFRKII